MNSMIFTYLNFIIYEKHFTLTIQNVYLTLQKKEDTLLIFYISHMGMGKVKITWKEKKEKNKPAFWCLINSISMLLCLP